MLEQNKLAKCIALLNNVCFVWDVGPSWEDRCEKLQAHWFEQCNTNAKQSASLAPWNTATYTILHSVASQNSTLGTWPEIQLHNFDNYCTGVQVRETQLNADDQALGPCSGMGVRGQRH